MPERHKNLFKSISTAELNDFGLRHRIRSKGGPSHPALSALIVQTLLARWKISSSKEDKHLIRMIEWITEVEDYFKSHNRDIWEELEKPDNGDFGPALRVLLEHWPHSKLPEHDSLVMRMQYEFLWGFIGSHPIAEGPTHRKKWLSTHWIEIDRLLRDTRCTCVYRGLEASPPDIPDVVTSKELLLCLLAHLHRSSSAAINQELKPSHRKPRNHRISKTSREIS